MSDNKKVGTENVKCKECGREFTMRKNLYAHMRNLHDDKPIDMSNKLGCALCDQMFVNYCFLQKHYQSEHSEVNLLFEVKSFEDQNSFDIWKGSFEKETVSHFIQRSTKKLSDLSVVKYYVCHRSGKSRIRVSDGERKRHVKTMGTNKINSSCPATMKVTKHSDRGNISVELQSVHVGHEHEAARLPLSLDERKLLAIQMEQGIPKSRVLANVRSNYTPSTRLSLIDKKDLHNICTEFNLDSEVCLDKNDVLSVHLKVLKMLKEPENDFLLGIMSNAQQKLLELNDGIVMIDSTHGLNQYQLKFTTLMVNDTNCEGFPAAVFYSSRETADVVKYFFDAISKRVPNLNLPTVFMSDDAPAYYNAWVNVFGECDFHLLCSWHVKRAWKKNLNSKVRVADLRSAIKSDLFELQEETDVVTFDHLCKSFFEKYSSNADAKSFLNYFNEEYMCRTKQWAYCYRVDCRINVNMKLERWHRLLKYEEGAGRVIKRLDKSLSMVLSAIRAKLFGRLISLERHKLTARVLDIRSRHDKIKVMNDKYSVLELDKACSWVVSKPHGNLIVTYDVNKVDVRCKCQLRCDACNICVHQFKCSCVDNCIRFNMCKHIHFVISHFSVTSLNSVEPVIPPSKSDEHIAISAELVTNRALTTENKRKMLLENLNDIKDLIVNAQTDSELDLIHNTFSELKTKYSLMSDNSLVNFTQCEKQPANKLVQKQVRF
nr:uncharacterized protein LOC107450172 [Parasteatoda tepidariorum]